MEAGFQKSETVGGLTFNMRYVPPKTFPTGVDDSGDIDVDSVQDIPPTATVANGYLIAETEVTYELWYKVYTWATVGDGAPAHTGEAQYTFGNMGIPGHDGTAGNETTSQEPVTTINWRDAMVFSNALTEYYNAMNGTIIGCVYTTDTTYNTPLRMSTNSPSITWDSGSIYSGTE
ncbi:MAG: SUMF1/EgtB/PvdO family nonheme iron enzyme, partial [Spirochaetia bacterium]|nr:SUMF1/EgtB/PvdO family nonheme iron enzyme [Spirochaetia bacterium]